MKLINWCSLVCLFSGISLLAEPGIFVDSQGKRYTGDIKVRSNGEVRFKGAEGGEKVFSRGQYRYVKLIPMPKELDDYQKLFEAKKYDTVIESATRLFQSYRYCGYGEFVAYFEASSLINRAKADAKLRKEEFVLNQNKKLLQALDNALSRGLSVRNDNNDYYYHCLELQLTVWMCQEDKEAELEEKMAQLLVSNDMMEVYVALKARGDSFKDNGAKEKAVAEYTKILLYTAATDPKFKVKREAVKKIIIELLGAKDPRAAVLSSL